MIPSFAAMEWQSRCTARRSQRVAAKQMRGAQLSPATSRRRSAQLRASALYRFGRSTPGQAMLIPMARAWPRVVHWPRRSPCPKRRHKMKVSGRRIASGQCSVWLSNARGLRKRRLPKAMAARRSPCANRRTTNVTRRKAFESPVAKERDIAELTNDDLGASTCDT